MARNHSVVALSSVSAKYIEKALHTVDLAEKRGIIIRVMGCVGVKIHTPKWNQFHEGVMERLATDLDFASLSKYRSRLKEFFNELGYETVRTARPEEYRIVFEDREGTHVDVFVDKLSMCHTIDLRDRLAVDSPTIPLSDIMLEKIQIVKITEKDIKDIVVLMLEHDVGGLDKETINGDYISKILARDWGFYYTSTTNLKLIKEKLVDEHIVNGLKKEDIATVKDRIDRLMGAIEREPKTAAWKIRESVGVKRKWYEDVEEFQTGQDFERELAKLLNKKK